ncbi:hypothetical protein [Paludibacterium sp.]|uniref:hypothetical protein n=1 Tax=Paludibacterium sp. TaxID=1917523 RepID=UPI0025EB68B7|nr:hypothetical protein [Paludibacterium sp.]
MMYLKLLIAFISAGLGVIIAECFLQNMIVKYFLYVALAFGLGTLILTLFFSTIVLSWILFVLAGIITGGLTNVVWQRSC